MYDPVYKITQSQLNYLLDLRAALRSRRMQYEIADKLGFPDIELGQKLQEAQTEYRKAKQQILDEEN